MKFTLTTALGSLGLVVLLSSGSWAQHSVPMVVPYDGYLQLDGGAIDDPLALRFSLYDEDDGLVWFEEHSSDSTRSCDDVESCLVPFYRGSFSVLLGSHVDIQDTMTGLVWRTEAEDVGWGGGPADGSTSYVLNSTGDTADAVVNVPVDGYYTFSARTYQQAAGPDDALIALLVDGATIESFSVTPTTLATADTVEVSVPLAAGSHAVGVRFTNDYNSDGDRNLVVDWVQLAGAHPQALTLGIAVRRSDDGTCGSTPSTDECCYDTALLTGEECWVSLMGRQQMVQHPYALWTVEADDFIVANDLQVLGSLNSEGELAAYRDTTLTGAITAATVTAPTVDVDGDLTVTTSASATGNAEADGDLYVSTGIYLDNQLAVSLESNALIFNGDGDFSGGTEFRSAFSITNSSCCLQISNSGQTNIDTFVLRDEDGTERMQIDGDKPMFLFEVFRFLEDSDVDTGISKADWTCFIGGYRSYGGDICAGANSNFMRMFTETDSNSWNVRASFSSCNSENEEWDVLVMCLQAGMVANMPSLGW